MSFGARLVEERRRLGLRQDQFAARARTTSPKQCLTEQDRRAMRGDYLARIAALGVDVVYVLTGRRSEGPWLPGDARALLSDHASLPPELRRALADFVTEIRRHMEK